MQPPAFNAEADHRRARILIVEDHADTLLMLTNFVKSEGDYEVVAVGDPDEAIAAATKGQFDLLLLDIGLPRISGVALLKRLRRHAPCKALALTGFGEPRYIKEYEDSGFDDWLIKPIDLALLSAAIKRALADGFSDSRTE